MEISVKEAGRLMCMMAATLVFAGCSIDDEPAPESGFKVSVKKEGKAADFKTELVHHVTLNREQLKKIKAGVSDAKAMGVMLNPERDHLGSRMGLRVVAVPKDSALSYLGFEVGDVITAVNRTALPQASDLPAWVGTLEQKRGGSATVQRRGDPHKLLYLLQTVQRTE